VPGCEISGRASYRYRNFLAETKERTRNKFTSIYWIYGEMSAPFFSFCQRSFSRSKVTAFAFGLPFRQALKQAAYGEFDQFKRTDEADGLPRQTFEREQALNPLAHFYAKF
jgi:hypothetical protein